MIVIIEKNANGKIEFTKEELEELLEKARAEGVRECQKNNYIYTQPSTTSPLLPNNPYVSPVTCETPQSISCGKSTSGIKLNSVQTINEFKE